MTSRLPTPLLHALLLIAAVIFVYRPSLDYGFVWDDHLYVENNPAVQSWSRAAEAFTSPRTTWSSDPEFTLPAWRPLRNLSYLLDHSLYGLNPIGWHLTNILLHAAGAVLLLFLLRRLLLLFYGTDSDDDAAQLTPEAGVLCLLAAAAWALHPIQTEVVAWVKSRDDLLATPLMFAALLLALPSRKQILRWERWHPAGSNEDSNLKATATHRRGTKSAIAAVLFYIAALLSKENAIILAALFPLITVIFARTQTDSLSQAIKLFTKKFLPLTITFAVIAIVYMAIRQLILGRTAQASWPGDGLSDTVLTMLSAFTHYIRLILWPWSPTVLSADYDGFPIVTSWANPSALTGLAILVALVAVALATVRRSPLVTIGIVIFLVAMLPFANIIPMMQIMAERFLYIPLAGAAVLLAAMAVPAMKRQRLYSADNQESEKPTGLSYLPQVATFLLVCALAAQTHRRLPVWQSDLTLFADTRQANPDSWRPADHYVKALLKERDINAALTAANQNLNRWPNDPDIIRTGALTYLLAGNETAGTSLTLRAVELQPNDFRASTTLMKWKRMTEREAAKD